MNTLETSNSTTASTLLSDMTNTTVPSKASGFYDVLAQLTLQQKRARQQRSQAR